MQSISNPERRARELPQAWTPGFVCTTVELFPLDQLGRCQQQLLGDPVSAGPSGSALGKEGLDSLATRFLTASSSVERLARQIKTFPKNPTLNRRMSAT